jgi:hypothetical protein
MKSILIRHALWCLASFSTIVSSSCTGDPSTGGIFWSETKARERLVERQKKLEETERGTNATERKLAEAQRKIDQL